MYLHLYKLWHYITMHPIPYNPMTL